MTPFARQFDNATYDSEHREREYRRGMEIMREMTVDDGDFDDDYYTHAKREKFQQRELI